ncbi:MAG TPA: caspase family protein, partial [Chloroflexia bacterium]|nr:caspase family protein [Chloroflexia bacterium]
MPVLDDAHAVVIGIAGYPNIGKLPAVVLKDAQDIRGILVDPDMCAYPPANVQLLLDDQAMRGKIRTSLADLAARTTPESTVFIYISSHGASIKSGPLAGAYLLPYDTVNDSAEALAGSSISGEEMTQSLAAIPAHKMVVVLDCCHAGGIGALKDAMAPEIKTGLPAEYFATLREGTGRVILSSSLSTESSQVLPNDENSLFTRFLLEGLRGEAPGPGGVIRILALLSYVQPKVAAAARQHPLLEAEVQENFPIALYPRLKAPTEVPAQAPADEFAYDAFISYQDREPDKA